MKNALDWAHRCGSPPARRFFFILLLAATVLLAFGVRPIASALFLAAVLL